VVAANNDLLIVDDDPDIVNSLKAALSANGYQAKTANSVRMAMEAISTSAPAIVFLDYYLPGDNPDVFVLKARKLYPQLLIVLMTAGRDAAEKAKNIGLHYYLSKPFSLEALLEVVRRGMAISGSRWAEKVTG
jgi:two-component system, NtrC family, response regulator AtoC